MPFTKVSVLIPTRGRAERLRRMMSSYICTSNLLTSELVFRADEDDQETLALLDSTPWEVCVGPKLDGYRSIPAFLEEMVRIARGDVLMVGNDDMIFETFGWDEKVLAEANKYPDGLFDIGLETLNTEHFPFSIISRLAHEKLGFVYDPRLFWGDIFLRDVMAGFGRAVLLPGVKVTHDWAGYTPDAVFREADGYKTSVGTTEYWEKHHAIVRETVERLS